MDKNSDLKDIITEKIKENLISDDDDRENLEDDGIKGMVKEKIKSTVGNTIKVKIYSAIAIMVILAIIAFIIIKNPFGWHIKLFDFGYAKIEKTENVIDQVKKISEFTTACYYQEFVMKNDKMVSNEGSLMNTIAKKLDLSIGSDSVKNELVLIVKGKVRAGFNLQKIKKQDFKINADTIEVNIPRAELFDIIINPSDYDVYVEEGKWSHEEITKIQSKTKAVLRENALKNGVLERANEFGLEKLKMLFKPFGFNVIDIKFQE